MKQNLLLSTALSLLLLTSCGKNYELPKELMDNGDPINPACIMNMFQGDSSRLENQPINCLKAQFSEEDIKGDSLSFDKQEKLATYKVKLIYKGTKTEVENTYTYKYLGFVGENIVLSAQSYSTDATGHFGYLEVVKRDGENIRLVGDIASGDRWNGGFFKNIELKDGIITYYQGFDGPGLRKIIKEHGLKKKIKKKEVSQLLKKKFQVVAYVKFTADLNQSPSDHQYQVTPLEIVEQITQEDGATKDGKTIKW